MIRGRLHAAAAATAIMVTASGHDKEEVHAPVALLHGVFEDNKALGAALRAADVLPPNGSVEACSYVSGCHVVFPYVPGRTDFWTGTTIVLEFIEPEKRVPA